VAFRINRNLSLSLFGVQVQQQSVSQEGKLESYDHKPDLLLIRTTGGYSVNFSDYRVPREIYLCADKVFPMSKTALTDSPFPIRFFARPQRFQS